VARATTPTPDGEQALDQLEQRLVALRDDLQRTDLAR